MIHFYWMDTFQSKHKTTEAAFKKAAKYIQRNGEQYLKMVDFYDFRDADRCEASVELKQKFLDWLKFSPTL